MVVVGVGRETLPLLLLVLLLLHHRVVHHLSWLLLHAHTVSIKVEWLLLLLLLMLLHLTHEGVAWLLTIWHHHHHIGTVGLLLQLLLRVLIGHHVRVLHSDRHEGIRLLILPRGVLHVVGALHHGWLLLLLIQGRRYNLNWLVAHVSVQRLEGVELGLLHETTLS